MLEKLLIVSFFFIIAFKVIASSPEFLSDESDAENALKEMRNLSDQILDAYLIDIKAVNRSLQNELQLMENNTIQKFNQKLDNIKAKIIFIGSTVEEFNISDCSFYANLYSNEIEVWRTKLSLRISKCRQLTTTFIDNLIGDSSSEMKNIQNGYITCNQKSIDNCKNFGKNETCFDKVTKAIKTSTKNIALDLKLVETNTVTRLESVKLPCQDLINFQISVYPEFNLDMLSACAENYLRMKRPSACSTLS